MQIVLKIAGIALVGSVLALVLRKENAAMAAMITVAVSGAIIVVIIDIVGDATSFLSEISRICDVTPETITVIGKAVGIAIVTYMTSSLCKDFGQQSAAGAVEMGGTAAILLAALPLMRTALKMIQQWISI